MNTTRGIPPAPAKSPARPGWFLILAVALLTALIGGSVLLLFGSQNELGRIDRDVKALDPANGDGARLDQLSQMVNTGWMAGAANLDKMQSMLDTMTKGKCCTLESDFAVGSLNWLYQAAAALSNEKQQASKVELTGDAGKTTRADLIKLYESHESLVQRLSGFIVDWNSVFDAARDRRLQETGEAIRAEQLAYTSQKAKLDRSAAGAHQNEGNAAAYLQELEDSIPAWRLRANLAIGGIGVGLLLFAGFVVFVLRSRAPAAQRVRGKTETRKQARKKRR